jgi:hypothetical protein
MIPFDPKQARHGIVLHGIDPATLRSNKTELEQWRVELQRQLIADGIKRHSLIQVNCEGIILEGNHGARAAADAGVPVNVQVIDLPHPSTGSILDIPIVKW